MSVIQMAVRRFSCLPTADVLTSTFGLLSLAQALMAACIYQNKTFRARCSVLISIV